jgi:uncharacterized protein YjbI with pentapeptide repeats
MEKIIIEDSSKEVHVHQSCIDESTFHSVSMQRVRFEDITLAGSSITNANLSGLAIEGAQLGGARFSNVGMPPEGHPMFKEGAQQDPIRFDHCDLTGSAFTDCNFKNVEIRNSILDGMKINGIPVEELLKLYENK